MMSTFNKPQTVPGAHVRSEDLQASEVAWFAPLCSDDFAYLGVPENQFKSSFKHTSKIALLADQNGFDNILCPSSYQVGQDTLSFVAAMAPMIKRMSMLAAVRCGEMHPPMLARQIATIDHMLEGRLTVNIISSDLPGETLVNTARYQKSREVIEILKQCWTKPELNHQGEFYQFKGLSTVPVQPYQQNGGPLLYFGGMSEPALELAAEHADVYLMWPETEDKLQAMVENVASRAERFGRRLDFGLRIHMIVRETEEEARAYARTLVSKLDDSFGTVIRNRSLDAKSLGVARQGELRDRADQEGYVESHLWTGIGRARSGCGAALVGTPTQILAKLERYRAMGFRAFIFSGYPHAEECQWVARLLLPLLKTGKLASFQGRIPSSEPMTPLGQGDRI